MAHPHTEDELKRLASIGIKRLCVICPAFVADCLETLEEIGMRGRQIFLAACGHEYRLIPCLNDHPLWIDALHMMVTRLLGLPSVVRQAETVPDASAFG